MQRTIAVFGICGAALNASQVGAAAETVEEFYRGKTITMYVGTGVGAGAVSAYPMAMIPVLKKYIPGHPNLILSYMPGAGGIKAATYIESIAPQDGTAWGFITRGFMLAPLLKLPQAQLRSCASSTGSAAPPARYRWAWSGTPRPMCAPSRTPCRQEVVVGATSIAQDTGIFPRALNRIVGTKFKIVTGYAGPRRRRSRASSAARCRARSARPGSRSTADRASIGCRTKLVTVLVQLGVKKAPDIPADIPLGLDLAKTPGGPPGARGAVRAERDRLSVLHGTGRSEGACRSDPRRLSAEPEGSGIHRGRAKGRGSTSIRSAPRNSPRLCAASTPCRRPPWSVPAICYRRSDLKQHDCRSLI